jgi:predicted small lipoprotein YifL
MKTAPFIAVLVFTVLCSGCGTKGPLYLPKKGDTPVKAAPLPDPVYPPVPAPETTTEKPG